MENPLYAKIFKWVSWALLIISVGLAVWAFTRFNGSGEDGAVNTLLVWAYIMLGIALVAVLCVGLYISATTDPKSLVRIGIGLGAAAVLCLVAYLLASGAPAIGFTGATPPTASELKLTDTVLNLTLFLGVGAVAAIIVGEVISVSALSPPSSSARSFPLSALKKRKSWQRKHRKSTLARLRTSRSCCCATS